MSARRIVAMACVGFAMTLASASPAFAAVPNHLSGNTGDHCASGPATKPGAPSGGGGCCGHFFDHQPCPTMATKP
jgi:hypothetical protein